MDGQVAVGWLRFRGLHIDGHAHAPQVLQQRLHCRSILLLLFYTICVSAAHAARALCCALLRCLRLPACFACSSSACSPTYARPGSSIAAVPTTIPATSISNPPASTKQRNTAAAAAAMAGAVSCRGHAAVGAGVRGRGSGCARERRVKVMRSVSQATAA
eukprot:scaffold171382_cov20-Tisochrysis_lutea.AAC.1